MASDAFKEVRSDAEMLLLFAAVCSDFQEVSQWSPNNPELGMALEDSDVLSLRCKDTCVMS